MNETTAIVQSRRTAHVYREDPVPEEVLRTALECAIRAPNHKLTNPWRFTRVGPKRREKLVEIAVDVKRAKGPITPTQERKLRAKVGSSPELLIVRQVLSDDPLRRREDYASCACAIQNLAVALWSEGVSSKWSTGGPTRSPATYELMGVDPDVEEIIGFVFIGYADPQPKTLRTPLEDVLDTVD